MILNLVILIFLIILGLGFFISRRLNINLLDILIFSNILFFGIYPFIDIVNDNYHADTILFVFTILYISSSLLLLRFLFKIFVKNNYKGMLNFYVFFIRVKILPQKTINTLFISATSVVIYYLLTYNLIFRAINEEINAINNYSQIILLFVFPLFTLVSIGALSKILKRRNNKKGYLINYLFLLLITLYWLFYGRREFIFHIIIMTLVLFMSFKGRINKKIIVYSFLGLIFIAVGSNIYQNLRSDIMSYSVNREFRINKTFIEMAFDFQTTNENIKQRTSALQLLSTIMDEISITKEKSKGEILLTSFNNALPKVLNKDKIYVNDDEIVARQLEITSTDFNTNLYSSFYVDFGIFSFIFLPLFYTLYYLLASILLFYLKKSKIMFVLLYVQVLITTFNVETSITSIFVSMRQIILITILYFMLYKFIYSIFKIRL